MSPAELVFVLDGPRLGWPRSEQVRVFREVLALPLNVGARNVIELAAKTCESTNLHRVDCSLAVRAALISGAAVVTFDRPLGRKASVAFEEP